MPAAIKLELSLTRPMYAWLLAYSLTKNKEDSVSEAYSPVTILPLTFLSKARNSEEYFQQFLS